MLHRKKGLRPNGFTLLELCVVLTILGGLVTLLFSHLISTEQIVHAELDRLHALCVYLQRKARIEKRNYSLVFDAKNSCCSGAIEIVLPRGVSLRTTFKNDTLLVSSEGTLSSGTVYLTDDTVAYALTVDVGAVRGLRRYRREGTWVCLDDDHQVH